MIALGAARKCYRGTPGSLTVEDCGAGWCYRQEREPEGEETVGKKISLRIAQAK